MGRDSVRELFRRTAAELERAGVESAAAEARLLIGEVLRLPPAVVPVSEREVSPAESGRLTELLRRRSAREPLQYLLGRVAFHDIELEVTPAVLIPRPETELLVEWVVAALPENGKLLDLGTGSGAIALAAAAARPDIHATGVDLQRDALKVAERNRRRLGIGNVRFLHSDLFSALGEQRFDLVAANLPYVPESDRPFLAPEVREHEPASALFAADGGFALIGRAAQETAAHLHPGGRTIFELDPRQASRLAAQLSAAGFETEIRRDLAGRDRFVTGILSR